MSPNTAQDAAARLDIPVIDISGYLAGDVQVKSSVASSVASAAQSPGFFQITGHNISADLISRLLDSLIAFFALPSEIKFSVHRSKSAALRGFEATGEQSLEKGFLDSKEGFMVGPERPPEDAGFLQGPNQWPKSPEAEGFRGIMMEYFDEMLGLSQVLFKLVALGLGLKEDYFDEFVRSENSISMMRAHRYPPTTPEMAEGSRGVGAHTDFGALTILLQDQIGGLEVFHRPTKSWHPVQPIEGAFVVNIGDMLERWTNDRYKSTLHRVVSSVSNGYRYSVAFFNEGLLDQVIECIPTCLSPEENPTYEPIQVEAHLRSRYGNSYS